jgi:hypothetical protein
MYTIISYVSLCSSVFKALMIMENINSELKVAESKGFQSRALVGHMCHKKFSEIFLFVCATMKYGVFIHLRDVALIELYVVVDCTVLTLERRVRPIAYVRFKRQLVNHAHVF